MGIYIHRRGPFNLLTSLFPHSSSYFFLSSLRFLWKYFFPGLLDSFFPYAHCPCLDYIWDYTAIARGITDVVGSCGDGGVVGGGHVFECLMEESTGYCDGCVHTMG
jgi:hypothetical protein